MAWDQIELTPEPFSAPAPTTGEIPCRVEVDETGIVGVWTGDRQVVLGDIEASVWRAPTDNDGYARPGAVPGFDIPSAWLRSGVDRPGVEVDDVVSSRNGASITLRRRLIFEHYEGLHVTRIALGDALTFHERVEVPKAFDDIPRVGVRFETPAELDQLEWYGLGPHETYPDRRGSGLVGRCTSEVGGSVSSIPLSLDLD